MRKVEPAGRNDTVEDVGCVPGTSVAGWMLGSSTGADIPAPISANTITATRSNTERWSDRRPEGCGRIRGAAGGIADRSAVGRLH